MLLAQQAAAGSWVKAGKLEYSTATFGDGDTIPNRSMYVIPLSGFLGYRWGKFSAGVAAEYARHWQTTDPATLNNQNAEGSSYAGVLELQWLGAKWGVSAGYRGLVNYSFANSDSTGQAVQYSGSGYSISILRTIRKSLGFYIEASFDSFEKMNEQALAPNVKNNRYGAGLLLSNFWK